MGLTIWSRIVLLVRFIYKFIKDQVLELALTALIITGFLSLILPLTVETYFISLCIYFIYKEIIHDIKDIGINFMRGNKK